MLPFFLHDGYMQDSTVLTTLTKAMESFANFHPIDEGIVNWQGNATGGRRMRLFILI